MGNKIEQIKKQLLKVSRDDREVIKKWLNDLQRRQVFHPDYPIGMKLFVEVCEYDFENGGYMHPKREALVTRHTKTKVYMKVFGTTSGYYAAKDRGFLPRNIKTTS